MEFVINGNKWVVSKKNGKVLVDKFNEDKTTDRVTYLFGLCVLPSHEIWLNEDMCFDQEVSTLKHELAHCWLWTYGMSYFSEYNEENLCDVISSVHDFIEENIQKYISLNKSSENKSTKTK